MSEKFYLVKPFIPKISGCGATDHGWDDERCKQFQDFLNRNCVNGWRYHSSEYRQAIAGGCFGSRGERLVCVFEKDAPEPGPQPAPRKKPSPKPPQVPPTK